MTEQNDPLDPIIAVLKEPVRIDAALTDRVMAAVRQSAAPAAAPAVEPWYRRRWTVRVGPLGGLAAAACLTAAVLSGRYLGQQQTAAEQPAALTTQPAVTQFVFVAPGAKQVTVVGDFNDWNLTATPMTPAPGNGIWSITVPLAPGRYRYAFVVDGQIWRPDPEAPSAEDEFGRPNSVVTIGGA